MLRTTCATLLAAATLIAGGAIAPKAARAEVQILTETAFHFDYSTGKEGQSGGMSSLVQHDLGVGLHLRYGSTLFTKHGRPFQLVYGPFLRFPIPGTFYNSGYGKDTISRGGLEPGVCVGVAWFGIARTLLSLSPSWVFHYMTTDFPGGDGTKIVSYDFTHTSAGFRLEVPAYTLESEPNDQRFQVGPFLSGQLDFLQSYTILPVNYDPDPADTKDTVGNGRTYSGTQKNGFRWMLGLFVNVKL